MHQNLNDLSCTYLRKQSHVFKSLECDLSYNLNNQVLHFILYFLAELRLSHKKLETHFLFKDFHTQNLQLHSVTERKITLRSMTDELI